MELDLRRERKRERGEAKKWVFSGTFCTIVHLVPFFHLVNRKLTYILIVGCILITLAYIKNPT